VYIGSTLFRILFDTCSCEFWVPSTQCQTYRCHRHRQYPFEKKIVTIIVLCHLMKLNIQYLSGKVQGDMIYETIKTGEVSVQHQIVGITKVVD